MIYVIQSLIIPKYFLSTANIWTKDSWDFLSFKSEDAAWKHIEQKGIKDAKVISISKHTI